MKSIWCMPTTTKYVRLTYKYTNISHNHCEKYAPLQGDKQICSREELAALCYKFIKN